MKILTYEDNSLELPSHHILFNKNLIHVKFKKLDSSAIIPSYGRIGDAGLDLTCTNKTLIGSTQIQYGTSLALKIPNGYVGLLFPRSSIKNYTLNLANSVGVIDENYIGEIKLIFNRIEEKSLFLKEYKLGERIAQLVVIPIPTIELEEVEELSSTNRGSLGFGSSGL